MKPQMPEWAKHPDPSYVTALEHLRRRYAYGYDQRPLILNTNAGPMLLDMETAIAWAERACRRVVGMTALLALLLAAAAASASLSPLIAIAAAWAGLIVGVMAAVNVYRSSLERGTAPPDVIVARVQKGRVIRVHKKQEDSA